MGGIAVLHFPGKPHRSGIFGLNIVLGFPDEL